MNRSILPYDFFSKDLYKSSKIFSFDITFDSMPYDGFKSITITDDIYSNSFYFNSGDVYFVDRDINLSGPYYSYSDGEEINLKVNSRNGYLSFYINDLILYTSPHTGTKQSTDYLGNININNVSDSQLDFSFDFYSNDPPIYFNDPYTNNRLNFSGYIINSGTDELEIYSGFSENGIIFSIPSSIAPGETGIFSFSGEDFSENQILNISFDTSAGILNHDFNLFSSYVETPTGFLNVFVGENMINTQREYSVYGYYPNEFEEDISLTRSQIGSKLIKLWGSGVGIGDFEGTVEGSGYIYGSSITGLIGEIGHEVPATGDGRLFVWGTGIIEHFFFVTVVGVEDGENYTGILEIGPIYGEVLDGSGHYVFDLYVTGTPDASFNYATINSSPTGIYTGHYYSVEIISSTISRHGTGELTNGLASFIFETPNIYDIVDVQIGTFAEDFEEFESFFTNGWYSGSNFIKNITRSGDFEYDLRVVQFQDKEDYVPSYWSISEDSNIFKVETVVYSEDVFQLDIDTPFESYTNIFSG